ncbi:retinitis pigmentosa 1-like 1 protein [Dipodomys merriami]|uniref:retinitis pigmentosa 1-like 1 protein n=1 Tax=Dipodomys merriami TaxID=94247 RepID=UPI00384CC00D
MNSTPSKGQAPSCRPGLPPSTAAAPSVARVTPAKKITFFKRGDPRFAGVRVAVHQRAFKTFSALMDELSQRVPLSFGVRSITTPRGLHSLSTLEQLQDGGCYLCSDRKPPKTSSGPGRPQGRSPSTLQSQGLAGGRHTPGASSWKGAAAPRTVTLVKHGDPRSQKSMVLSPRNTRSLAAFLSRASDLLRFPVKQLYTTSGEKVDCLQALLHSPSVLVCAGKEALRALEVEDAGIHRAGTSSGLTSRSKNGRWGPKAKQSVIHLRPRSGGKPPKFSLLPAKSGPGEHPSSGTHAWVGSVPHSYPQVTLTHPGPLVAGDNVGKKVHVNEDGSLSVEMKVCFQLLGADALLRSQGMGRASTPTAASGEAPVLGDAEPLCCRPEGRPCSTGESGTRAPAPLGALGSDWRPGPSYDIWRNPLCAPPEERPTPRRTWGPVHLSRCRRYGRQGTHGRRRHSQDSISPASSADSSEPDSCDPRALGSGGDSSSPCPASVSAARSRVEQEAVHHPRTEGVGFRDGGQCGCLGPRTRGVARAPSDSSANPGSPEEASKQDSQHPASRSQARAVTAQGKAAQDHSPRAPSPSPPSLSSMDLQAEKCGWGPGCSQARSGPVARLPLSVDRASSWDAEGGSVPPPASAPAQRARRKQRRLAGSLGPSSQAAQRGQAGWDQCCCHAQGSSNPAALQAPRPPARRRACPSAGTLPTPPRARKQTSEDLGPPSLGSQDLAEAKNAVTTSRSNSNGASRSHGPRALSEEPAGDKCRVHGSAPTAAHVRGAGSLGDEAAGSPRPSSSSILLDGCPHGGASGAPHGCCCSQTEACRVSEDPTRVRAISRPSSEACRGHSGYFPTPPGEPPRAEKRHSSCSGGSVGRRRADEGAGSRRGLPGAPPSAEQNVEGREEDPLVMPSTLPHSSPDAIVREWLGSIPEAPALLGYEMAGETTHVAGHGPEGLEEEADPGDNRSLKGWVELPPARQQSSAAEPADALLVASGAGPGSEADRHQDKAPGEMSLAVPAEAGEGEAARGCHGVSPYALPGRISASTQIMKALLGTKQDRPSSLPEVSGTAARRLSHSAGALIACLASLRFFDEDLGALAGKAGLRGSSGYQELLTISQALWPGCGLEQGRGDLGLGTLASHRALPVTQGFTPTSSSGVDVSSGSAGSGEGSVPCAMDGALAPERAELPPEVSQRPDSGTLRYPEGLGAPQPSPSTSSTSSQETERDNRKQESRPAEEQFVENSVQEDGEALEETEGEGTQGEERILKPGVSQHDMSGAGSGDREGSEEDMGMLEEEAGRDAPSAGLCPPGRVERPAEPTECPSHQDSPLGEGPRGSRGEAAGEELPRGARTGPGTGKEITSVSCRESLDPDPVWVSRLLKKLEKAFMAHLAGAMAALRARWNLQDSSQLDQMAAELEREVSLRLQESTSQELWKVQARAGRTALGRTIPGPPRGALWGQTSLQTEQRRRRLWGLHNLSVFPEPAPGQGPLPCTPEDPPTLGPALGREAAEDEFCPCHACARKRAALLPRSSTVGAVGAPIRRAFDLQQILQTKKGGGMNGEAEAPPEDLWRTEGGRVLGLSPGPVVGKGEGQGESPRPGGGEDPEPGEAEGAECPEREEEATSTPDQMAGRLEDSVVDKAGTLDQGSEARDPVGAEGEQEKGQTETEEGQESKKKSGALVNPGKSQSGEASRNSSLHQEGRPTPPTAPEGGSPPHTPSSQTPCATCGHPSTGSLGDCSQASQKGSEEDYSNRDPRCTEVGAHGAPHAERRITTMYPESSTSEQEEAPSEPRTPVQGADEDCDQRDERVAGNFACAQTGDRAGGFGQDDLDF